MIKNLKLFFTLGLLVSLIAACAPMQADQYTAHSVANPNCVGQIGPIPDGLKVSQNTDLLESALGAKGKGMLCQGQVYEALEPITVYRVWDKSKSWSAKGSWWSFDQPGDSRTAYQVANDICPEWSALDMVHSCKIKVGTHIVVGTGQSAQCDKEFLKQSATNQVYINNDTRKNIYQVDDCSPSVPWPTK